MMKRGGPLTVRLRNLVDCRPTTTHARPELDPPAVALRERDAARYLSVSTAYLRAARRGRTSGPDFIRVHRMILYSVKALDLWLASHAIRGQRGGSQ